MGDALAAEVRQWVLAAPGWAPEAQVTVNQDTGACVAEPSGTAWHIILPATPSNAL